jgi:hypothetical protein
MGEQVKCGPRPSSRSLDGKTRPLREEKVMVDPSRKHGQFDSRYAEPRRLATPDWELLPAQRREGRVLWSVFLERFFSSRRRHDFEALAWYEAYRNAFDRALPERLSAPGHAALGSHAERRRAVPAAPPAGRAVAAAAARRGAADGLAPSSALLDWESEGGNARQD